MGGKAEWRGFAALGSILVGITFTDVSPAGPWNDSTFTSGSLGLIGMILLYLAWFRLTFGVKGVVPTMDMWKDPEETSKLVMLTGIVILGISYAIGRIDFFPEPAGLVLSLVGLLVTTNGIYVWLSTSGPLRDVSPIHAEDTEDNQIEHSKLDEDLKTANVSQLSNVTYNIQIQDSVIIDSKIKLEEE